MRKLLLPLSVLLVAIIALNEAWYWMSGAQAVISLGVYSYYSDLLLTGVILAAVLMYRIEVRIRWAVSRYRVRKHV